MNQKAGVDQWQIGVRKPQADSANSMWEFKRQEIGIQPENTKPATTDTNFDLRLVSIANAKNTSGLAVEAVLPNASGVSEACLALDDLIHSARWRNQ